MRLNFSKNRELPIEALRTGIRCMEQQTPEEVFRSNPGMAVLLKNDRALLCRKSVTPLMWKQFLKNFFIAELAGPHKELAGLFAPLAEKAEVPCVLGGHVLVSRLDIGSDGCVFKTAGGFALKITGDSGKNKLEREYRLLKQIRHENIVRCFDFITGNGFAAMVMELLTPEPGDESSYIRALEHCHSQGILHGDIRVKNLGRDLQNRSKIFDFGNARAALSEEEKISEIKMLKNVLRSPAFKECAGTVHCGGCSC